MSWVAPQVGLYPNRLVCKQMILFVLLVSCYREMQDFISSVLKWLWHDFFTLKKEHWGCVRTEQKFKISVLWNSRLFKLTSMSYFVMINLKAISSWSRLHVGLVILCCYETPCRWHLCAETCNGWQFTWSVFCDSCSTVFYSVHFVGSYSECKETHGMNNVILAIDSLTPNPPSLHTVYCTSCWGSKLRAQQYTANCN